MKPPEMKPPNPAAADEPKSPSRGRNSPSPPGSPPPGGALNGGDVEVVNVLEDVAQLAGLVLGNIATVCNGM